MIETIKYRRTIIAYSSTLMTIDIKYVYESKKAYFKIGNKWVEITNKKSIKKESPMAYNPNSFVNLQISLKRILYKNKNYNIHNHLKIKDE